MKQGKRPVPARIEQRLGELPTERGGELAELTADPTGDCRPD
jgi:hypothetical protein